MPTATAARAGNFVTAVSRSTRPNPLSINQQAFASRLAADTGLDAHVIAAWIIAEEPAGAATPVGHADQNWLNIGNVDNAPLITRAAWTNPVTAADQTATWLQGKTAVPGFGKAAAGIVAFSRTAGQSPQAQIQALQSSGWASSGYPDLPGLYGQLSGVALNPSTAASGSTASATGSLPSSKSVGQDLLRALVTVGLAVAGAAIAGLGIRAILQPVRPAGWKP